MILKKIIALVLCLFFSFYYTQTKESIEKEIEAVKKIYMTDPGKTLSSFLKINRDSKKINYSRGIIDSGKYLMALYHNSGEEEKSIEYTHIVEDAAKEIHDYESIAAAYIERSTVLSALGLSDESYNEAQVAIGYADKIPDPSKKHYSMSLIYQGLAAGYYIPKKAPQDTILAYLKKSLAEAEQMTNNIEDIKQTDMKYDMLSYLNMNIGMFYTMNYKPQRLDLAEKHLLKSLEIINTHTFTEINISKLPILTALGQFYSVQNKHDKALDYARETLKIEKSRKSPRDRLLAYVIMTNSYEGIKNKDSTIKYMELYSGLSDSLNYINKQTANTAVKKINASKDKAHKTDINTVVIIASTILALIILGGWFFWKKNQETLHKKYTAIIQGLKEEKKQYPISEPVLPEVPGAEEKNSANPLMIAENTTTSLLNKLSKFERSERFLKKDMTLTALANSLNTNTRYLSEIIKQHKGKNFNNYLNGLRIHYITNKLYEDPIFREYKVSYLAEACGFSSREVFAVVFKKETGVTPSYFINQLKKDNDDQNGKRAFS